MLTAVDYHERWCIDCARTTVHKIHMTGTTDKRRVIVIVKCCACGKGSGRIA